MRVSRRQKQINKQRELSFVNCWSVSDGKANYDALADKFTTYYFSNPTVKKHLRKVTKAIKKQPTTSEAIRIAQLINYRLQQNSLCLSKFSEYDGITKARSTTKSLRDKNPNTFRSQQKFSEIEKINPEPIAGKLKQITKTGSLCEVLPPMKSNRIYLSKDEKVGMTDTVRKQKFIDYLANKKKQILQKKNN